MFVQQPNNIVLLFIVVIESYSQIMEKQDRNSASLVGLAAIVGSLAVCLIAQKFQVATKAEAESKISTIASIAQPILTYPIKPGKVVIIYGTTTGTGKVFASKLQRKLLAAKRIVEVCSMSEYDQEKLVKEDIVLIICSTWTNGEAPESCKGFMDELKDYAYDFRVSKNLLEKVHFAVFGLGAELYGNNYGKAVSFIILCFCAF